MPALIPFFSASILPGHLPVKPDRPYVLVVSHEASLSGAPILAQNLAVQISRQYNVIVLALSGGPILDAFRDGAVAVWTPRRTGRRQTRIARAVRALTARYRIHFAIVNSAVSFPVARPLAAAKVPMVALMHEFAAYLTQHDQIRTLFDLSDVVVFEAPLTEQDGLRRIGMSAQTASKVLPQGQCVVPGAFKGQAGAGADTLRQALRPTADDSAFVVLGAGGVEYRKGVDLFIAAAAAARDRAPEVNWRFVWIGGALSSARASDFRLYLADQIDRSGVADIVTFLPATPDIGLAFGLADAFFLSSRLEPLGNVAIDALAEGLPMICFAKAAGFADFLEEAGLAPACVAPYLDVFGVADLLINLARSPKLCAQVAEGARRLARERLRIEDYADKLIALGETSAARGKAGSTAGR